MEKQDEETYVITADTKITCYSKGPEMQKIGIELVEEGSPTLNLEFQTPGQMGELLEAVAGAMLMDLAHKHVFVSQVHEAVGCERTHQLLKAAKQQLDDGLEEIQAKPH